MNIIRVRQAEREQKIELIMDRICNSTFDYESIILWCMSTFLITDRTAKEYTKVALFRLKMTIEDLNKKKREIQKSI
jgi:hypothetical protein